MSDYVSRHRLGLRWNLIHPLLTLQKNFGDCSLSYVIHLFNCYLCCPSGCLRVRSLKFHFRWLKSDSISVTPAPARVQLFYMCIGDYIWQTTYFLWRKVYECMLRCALYERTKCVAPICQRYGVDCARVRIAPLGIIMWGVRWLHLVSDTCSLLWVSHSVSAPFQSDMYWGHQ